mgnify:CR=1 FL=1
MALEEPTKVTWDWSKAGQTGRKDDHYTYLKIKGEFTYASNFAPTYLWFNGNNEYRYLLGDPIARNGPTYINKPAGSITDPKARIFPFKLHDAKQPIEILRTIHSFDPCIACAVHVTDPNGEELVQVKVV